MTRPGAHWPGCSKSLRPWSRVPRNCVRFARRSALVFVESSESTDPARFRVAINLVGPRFAMCNPLFSGKFSLKFQSGDSLGTCAADQRPSRVLRGKEQPAFLELRARPS